MAGIAYCPICKNYFGTPDTYSDALRFTSPKTKCRHTRICCPCGKHKVIVIAERANFTHKDVFFMSIKKCDPFDHDVKYFEHFQGKHLELCDENDPNVFDVTYIEDDIRKIISDSFFRIKKIQPQKRKDNSSSV